MCQNNLIEVGEKQETVRQCTLYNVVPVHLANVCIPKYQLVVNCLDGSCRYAAISSIKHLTLPCSVSRQNVDYSVCEIVG